MTGTDLLAQALDQLDRGSQPTDYRAPAVSRGGYRMSGLARADDSTRSAFIRSTYPVAKEWERRTGLPAELLQAITASESNWGQAPGNELFGIKGPGTRLQTHEVVNGRAVPMEDSFRAYPSVDAAYRDFADLVSGGRYAPAWQQFQQDHDPASFVRGINAAGYATDPNWADKVLSLAQSGVRSLQPRAGDQGAEDLVPKQFGDHTLTPEEAYAACGPVAAVALARAQGREPTLREALDLAKETGWTPGGGMNGLANEFKLMQRMGIASRLDASPSWEAIQHDAQNGNPVVISTPGHYFVADAFDPQSGKYHVGNSGMALAHGGSAWMSPAEMQSAQGAVNGALFSDYPGAANPSVAAYGDSDAYKQAPTAETNPYYGPGFDERAYTPSDPEADERAYSGDPNAASNQQVAEDDAAFNQETNSIGSGLGDAYAGLDRSGATAAEPGPTIAAPDPPPISEDPSPQLAPFRTPSMAPAAGPFDAAVDPAQGGWAKPRGFMPDVGAFSLPGVQN